jgi:hypothetical protein
MALTTDAPRIATMEPDVPVQMEPGRAGRPSTDPWAALWLVGLGTVLELAIWWGFVQPYQLRRFYQILTPFPLDLAKINGVTLDSFNAWAITWVVAFVACYLAYRRAPRAPTGIYYAVLAIFALLFNATLLFMHPVGAADLFDQLFRGRILAHYGANPFTTPPNVFPDDPLRPWVGGWAHTGSPYGPTWEYLAAATSRLAGDDLWANLILFKLLVILAYGVAAWLLWATLRRLRPDWAARGLLLFAWNPLVLFETAGNGHNDMVMIAALLGALYLLVRGGRWAVLAPAALMLAALVKFVPALLMLPVLVALWHDDPARARRPPADANWPPAPRGGRLGARLRRVGSGAALAGLVAVALYAPLWAGPATIGALGRTDLFTASIPRVALDWLTAALTPPGASEAAAGRAAAAAEDWVRGVALGLIVGFVLVQSLRIHWVALDRAGRGPLLHATLGAVYEILFVYLMFATLWFQPWYLQWLIAVTPLTGSATRVGRTLWFVAGGVANYFVWDFLWLWNRAPTRAIQATAALVVSGPALLYTAYTALLPKRTVNNE